MRSQSVTRRGERLSIIIVYSRLREEQEVSDEQEDVITRSPSILERSADARAEIRREPPNPSRISTSPIATTSSSLQEKNRTNVSARVGDTSRRRSWPWLSIGPEIKAADLRSGPITTRISERGPSPSGLPDQRPCTIARTKNLCPQPLHPVNRGEAVGGFTQSLYQRLMPGLIKHTSQRGQPRVSIEG